MGQLDRDIWRRVRQRMAENGIEVTPNELEDIRASAFARIRAGMAFYGYDMPDDDEELLCELKRAWLLDSLTKWSG